MCLVGVTFLRNREWISLHRKHYLALLIPVLTLLSHLPEQGNWSSTGSVPCSRCESNKWAPSINSTSCVPAIPMSNCVNSLPWDSLNECGPLLNFSTLTSRLFFTPNPYASGLNYFTAVDPPLGHRLTVEFLSFATESPTSGDGDPVIITTTAGPFLTSTPVPYSGPLFMERCAGQPIAPCSAGTKYGNYSAPLVVQLFSDSSASVYSGITFRVAAEPCPERYFCGINVSTPTLCPSSKYCPAATIEPLDCPCCSEGSASPQSCSETPSQTPSPTPSSSQTASVTPSRTPSVTKTPTRSDTRTNTPSSTGSRTTSQTPSSTRSPSPSVTAGVPINIGSLVPGSSYSCRPLSCLVVLSIRGGDGGSGSFGTTATSGGLGACFNISLALDSQSSLTVSVGRGGANSSNAFSSGGGGGASAVDGGVGVLVVAGGGGGGGGASAAGFTAYGGNASLPGEPAFNGGAGSPFAVGGSGASLTGPGAGSNSGGLGFGGAGGSQCANPTNVSGGSSIGTSHVRAGGNGQNCSASNVKAVGGGGGAGFYGGSGGSTSADFGGGGGGGLSRISGTNVALLSSGPCSAPLIDGSVIVLSVTPISPSASPSVSPTLTPTPSLPPPPPPRPSNAPASFTSFSTASGARNLSDAVFPPDAILTLNDNGIGISQIVVRASPCSLNLSLCWSPNRVACGKPSSLESTYDASTCTLTRVALAPTKFTAAEAVSTLRTLSFSASSPTYFSLSLSLTNAICASNGPCAYTSFVTDTSLGCSTYLTLHNATYLDLYRPRVVGNGCYQPPSVFSEVAINSPAFFILPNTAPAISITEGAAPTALWPSFLSSWTPSSTPRTIFYVRITIVSGCTAADMLSLVPGVGPFALPPPLSVVSLASTTGCPADIELRGATALGFVNLALRQVRMSSSSLNVAPASLLRVIRVDIDDFATAFTTVAVTPVNDAVNISSPSYVVDISEGLPDFGVVIRQSCDGSGRDTLFGLPVICLTDADPPFVRAAPVSDSYVGARGVGTETASAYSLLFDNPSCTSCASACAVNARVAPVGAPVYDCSQAQPELNSLGPSVACVFQRFRLLVGTARTSQADALRTGTGFLPAGANSSFFSLDAQAAYCEPEQASVSGTLSTEGLSFTTVLLVTDALRGTPSNVRTFGGITISLVKDDEVPVLAFPDASLAATLGAPAPPPSPAIFIDDATGNATGATFFLCSQVSSSRVSWNVSVGVLEGSGAHSPTTSSNATLAPNSLLVAAALSPPTRVLLRDAKPCAAAYISTANAVASIGASSTEVAWTWVQNFTLQSAPGVVLSALRTRVLTASVSAVGGAPLIIPVTITRTNRPVSWTETPTQLTTSEHFAGVLSPDFNVNDADAAQAVVFRVVSATPVSCTAPSSAVNVDGCRYSAAKASLDWTGAFSIEAVPRSAVAVVDASTGLTSFVNATRAARLSVSSALDTTEMACFLDSATTRWPTSCTVDVTLEARDAANVSATHAMLPSARVTSSVKTVSVVVTSVAAPSISFVELPSGGLSVRGGDVFFVSGINLSAGIGGVINASLVVVDDTAVVFPLVCGVVRELTRLRCVSSAGWGTVTLHLTVGGRLITYAPLNYRAASVLALAANPQSPATWSLSLNSTAQALTDASAAPPSYIDDALAGLVQSSFAPAVASFSALVIDVPSVAALDDKKRCVTFSAGIALVNGTFVPIYNCVRDVTAVSPSAIPVPPFSALAALNVSASWVTCSVTFSAGVFRRIAVSASVGACVGGPAMPLLAPRLSAAVERRRPSITNISQPASNSSFTILGVNFGSGAVADDGDVVEYAAVNRDGSPVPACIPPPSTPLAIANAGVSCAVHRAVGCFYAFPNTHVTCDVDPDAWGAGYRVRVVVRGAASEWSASTISHGRPRLISVRPVAIPGALNDSSVNVTTDKALEGAGGGLLLLRGENLWPPHALVITVGGVRVHAIDAKPLAGGPRYAPTACFERDPSSSASTLTSPTPSASPTATTTVTPTRTASQTLQLGTPTVSPSPSPSQSQSHTLTLPANGPCFGDAGTRSRAARRAPPAFTNASSAANVTESSILVIAPPGFGTISVRVSVGGFDPASALVSYRDPSITGMELAGGELSKPGDIQILVHGFSISPCIMCAPRSGGRGALNDGSVCRTTQLPSSSLPAVQRALRGNTTNEGTLPTPFLFGTRFDKNTSSCDLPYAPCLSDCALPDELWSMAMPTAPRIVESFPDVDLTLEGNAVDPVTSVYIVAANTGGADFTLKTSLRAGTLVSGILVSNGFSSVTPCANRPPPSTPAPSPCSRSLRTRPCPRSSLPSILVSTRRRSRPSTRTFPTLRRARGQRTGGRRSKSRSTVSAQWATSFSRRAWATCPRIALRRTCGRMAPWCAPSLRRIGLGRIFTFRTSRRRTLRCFSNPQ